MSTPLIISIDYLADSHLIHQNSVKHIAWVLQLGPLSASGFFLSKVQPIELSFPIVWGKFYISQIAMKQDSEIVGPFSWEHDGHNQQQYRSQKLKKTKTMASKALENKTYRSHNAKSRWSKLEQNSDAGGTIRA